MLEKPRMLALSMVDLWPEGEEAALRAEAEAAFPPGLEVFPVSAVTGRGLLPLKRALWDKIRRIHAEREAAARSAWDDQP
jgi:hypothetical protein